MSVIYNSIRLIHKSTKYCRKVTPHNLKGKKLSSQLWLQRQLSDPYVEKAKMLNYRCRSAFKLVEIDEKCGILKPGQIVIDCGAAPGSWTQVATNKVNADGSSKNAAKGTVIAVDQQYIQPINGAIILGNSDFTTEETQAKIRGHLGDSKVDVVLSDMAPKATGIHEMDSENIIHLCYTVLRFALQVSQYQASLIVKLWECKERELLEKDISKFYSNVKIVKPNSSRANSAEIFIVGLKFKGVKNG